MTHHLLPVFAELRAMLESHSAGFAVQQTKGKSYVISGPVGPATIQVWKGEVRSRSIPVASVTIQKNYVSFHLMPVYGDPSLLKGASEGLINRMQGKSCFNFAKVDTDLFKELSTLTQKSIAAFVKRGFVIAQSGG